jgi:hypothetical protein
MKNLIRLSLLSRSKKHCRLKQLVNHILTLQVTFCEDNRSFNRTAWGGGLPQAVQEILG